MGGGTRMAAQFKVIAALVSIGVSQPSWRFPRCLG